MLWVDKVCLHYFVRANLFLATFVVISVYPSIQYRPHSFDKFVIHKQIADNLKKLVREERDGIVSTLATLGETSFVMLPPLDFPDLT